MTVHHIWYVVNLAIRWSSSFDSLGLAVSLSAGGAPTLAAAGLLALFYEALFFHSVKESSHELAPSWDVAQAVVYAG